MAEIQLQNCTFYYSDFYKPVFENLSITIDTGWKLGLIGRNGRGKTTLLRLIHGELSPCSGSVKHTGVVEMFPYSVDEKYTLVMDVMKENIGGMKSLEEEMEETDVADEKQMPRYSSLLEQYLDSGGYELESKIKKELYLMGLSEDLLDREYESLSGGEKTKIQIIILFLRKAEYILLDEPTNHLDAAGKQYLAEYLRKKKGFLIVSHEKEFLDTVVDHILAINKCSVELEQGNFSTWQENKEKRELFESRTRDRLIREVKQLERRAEAARSWAGVANQQKYAFRTCARTNGSKAFMLRAKNAEMKVEADLEKKKQLLKNYEKHQELIIEQGQRGSDTLLYARHLSFGYGGPFVIRDLSFSVERGDCIWIRGRNGCGKSTLLKLLSGELEPAEGSIDLRYGVRIAVIHQEPVWERGALGELVTDKDQLERIQQLCKTFDLSHEVLKRPIETYSSGERKKIEIARCFADQNQIILMDEPLNYMDTYFKQQMEEAILKFKPSMIFVEHNAGFGEKIATKVLDMEKTGNCEPA